MKKPTIAKIGKENKEIQCSGDFCRKEIPFITKYESEKEMIDCGWLFTSNMIFSKKREYVWICPFCFKKTLNDVRGNFNG